MASPSEAERNRADRDATSAARHDRTARFIAAGRARGPWQLPDAELRVAGEDALELGCGEADRSRSTSPASGSAARARRSRAKASTSRSCPRPRRPCPRRTRASTSCSATGARRPSPTRASSCPRRLASGGPAASLALPGGTPPGRAAFDEAVDTHGLRLERGYSGLHRFETPEGSVEFMLPTGEWMRLFREHGLAVERLVEVRPPEGAASSFRSAAETAWARRFPMEQVWVVRRA